MRFFLLMAGYGLFVVVIETTLLAGWPAQMLRFDLIIPAVAAVSFYHERRNAVPVLVFYGVLMDVVSGAPFGMSILSYLVIYSFVRAIIAKISFQEGVALLFWVAILSLLDKVVCGIVMMVSTGEMTIPGIIIERAPAQALLDAAMGLFTIPLLTRYWGLTWEKIRKPRGLQWREMPRS